MIIKIYFGSRTVYLSAKEDIQEWLGVVENHLVIDICSASEVDEVIGKINSAVATSIFLTHSDVTFLQERFFSQFEYIEAAGGLVMNSKKEILFIFRRGKWDLPKGKMEAGETPEIAAAREIEEETGVSGLKLVNKITDTYHVYQERGISFLKKTYWYFFTTDFAGEGTPQTEEDITSISWIAKEHMELPVSNTYDSIMDVIKAGAPIY